MPSGKRAKQQRRDAATAVRTPPPVRSKGAGGARPRQASPRALGIAGGVVLVLVIAVVLGIVLTRGSSNASGGGFNINDYPQTGSATGPTALPNAPQANAQFNGIPQQGLVLGKPNAPVEMDMFIDVQCPICQNYEESYMPTIIQNNIRNGKVQLHLLPWAFIGGKGSQSFSGRLGLIAASFQNKGFEYGKVLYDNQGTEDTGWLTNSKMAEIASSVNGLDMKRWWTDTNGSEAKSIASEVDTQATKRKVGGTPTVFVGCAGRKLHNVMPPGPYSPDLQTTQRALNAAIASCAK